MYPPSQNKSVFQCFRCIYLLFTRFCVPGGASTESLGLDMDSMPPRPSSRRKKTRYLSLRRRLAAAASATSVEESSAAPASITTTGSTERVQLDLFPLHPADATADDPQDEQLARFFPCDDDASLHSLLGPHSSTSSSAFVSEDQLSPSTSSPNYSACSSSYCAAGAAVVGLARAALRGRERWRVPAEGEESEGASDGAAGLLSGATRRLSLKLDYDAVIHDWSGDRPLIVDGDCHQVVPDIGSHTAHFFLPYTATVFVDVVGFGSGGGPSGFWAVPDGVGDAEPSANGANNCGGSSTIGDQKDAERVEEEEERHLRASLVREEREARVKRYREKRRHRLFAKRIRYEVRKLNAEKRPRIKGRFVKRDGES